MTKLAFLVAIATLLTACDEQYYHQVFGGQSIASTAPGATPIRNYTLTMPGERNLRHGTINRATLRRLIYFAPGQSRHAMNSATGVPGIPYAYTGSIEWRRMADQPSTWVGIEYGADGRYQRYHVSGANGGE
jgi:hypothetical protein